jgi:DNA primase
MLEQKKLSILESILGDWRTVPSKNGTEYVFFCPECKHHKKKFSINPAKGFYKCWVCNVAGSVFSLIKKHGTADQIASWKELAGIFDHSDEFVKINTEIDLPKEFITLSKPNVMANKALLYLASRNISKEDIIWWKMGFCPTGTYRNRIVVPSYDISGNLNYFVGRAYDNNPQAYVYPSRSKDLVFNELFLDWEKDIILTEGIFDAIVAGNAIPLLGSTLIEQSIVFQTIVSKTSRVFLGLDPDAVEKENKIIQLFLSYGVEVFKIPIKPYKDIGKMDKETFQRHKNEALELTKDNILQYLLEE